MRVLITGGAGFIGSHLVEHYQGKAKVRVLDNFRTGYRKNLEGLDVELMEGSVCDPQAVAQAMAGVDLVFHLAAFVSVPESVEKPEECEQINIQGFTNVLEAAANAGAKKVLFASSAAIYGDNPTVPKVEAMEPEPKSPYASTKLGGEKLAETYTKTRGLQTAALRFFNVFGPRQDPKSAYAAAVPIFMAKALSHEPLTIFGDGQQTRDFIFVKDIVNALTFLAEHESATGVYNAGYGGQITVGELALEIIRLAQSRSEIHMKPERLGDVKHSRASVDKLKSVGWLPKYSVSHGLAATLSSFRNP